MGPTPLCPVFAPLLGVFGVVFALSFSCFGAAYGMARSSVGIFSVGAVKPDIIMKSLVPVIMASILGIYGLVSAALMFTKLSQEYSLYAGALQLAGGLCVGLGSLSGGLAIGIIGDAGIRAYGQQPKLFTGMILTLIFAEVLGLYGLLVCITLNAKAGTAVCG